MMQIEDTLRQYSYYQTISVPVASAMRGAANELTDMRARIDALAAQLETMRGQLVTVLRERDGLREVLEGVRRTDRTPPYEHHEPRPDGLKPRDGKDGGTCWLTPKVIAERALARAAITAPPPSSPTAADVERLVAVPDFKPGDEVVVNHDRYHGEAVVAGEPEWSGGGANNSCIANFGTGWMVAIRLENGNVWWYEAETVTKKETTDD